jgi:hypothetical protein
VGVTHDATSSKLSWQSGCHLSKKRVVEWTKIPSSCIESKVVQFSMDGIMEMVRDKSFWGAVVFVAMFVTSIIVLLADKAVAR